MAPTTILLLWLIIALLVAAVYIYVWSTTKGSGEAGATASLTRFRKPLFIAMVVVLGATFLLTVPRAPYPKGQIPDAVVYITAKQFAFAQSLQPVSTDEEFGNALGYRAEVPMERWVEFRVTSLDVNHGVAIFDPDGKLVGQTQAMPGYVNRLFVRLRKPGSYTIRCLEYCGTAHHVMQSGFEAVAQKLSSR
jgi:cytochrome c oxidase subunit 2